MCADMFKHDHKSQLDIQNKFGDMCFQFVSFKTVHNQLKHDFEASQGTGTGNLKQQVCGEFYNYTAVMNAKLDSINAQAKQLK